MPIYQGLYIPAYLLACLLTFHWLLFPPASSWVRRIWLPLICMWLTLVSVHPCPVQQRSWRPQGGGGGALQGSAQPELQRYGEKFLKPALPSRQLGSPCRNKDMPKFKDGNRNSGNSLPACFVMFWVIWRGQSSTSCFWRESRPVEVGTMVALEETVEAVAEFQE